MNCNELVELITNYLEGRLPAADVRRFDAHLEECDACVTYVDQIRTSIALLGTLREDTLPPGAADALLAEFRDWKRDRG
jgi:anti-sigma factor RsiW